MPDIDIAIGTGSSVHLSMLNYKNDTKCKAVVCMKPSALLINHFDLCFIPEHDEPGFSDNIVRTTGPPNRSRNLGRHDPHRGLVLVGGENAMTRKWDAKKILSDIRTLIEKEQGRKWTISTSPRTPAEVEHLLGEMLKEHGGTDFCPFHTTESGWIDEQYHKNEMVWITGDSMSMIYEGLSAGCHVGILPVCWKNKKNKYTRSIQQLEEAGRIVQYTDFLTGSGSWVNNKPLDEADKCAKEILKRWHLKD